MSLGDDISAALPELRAHAESMMRDSVKVEAPTGTRSMDPTTLEMTDDYTTVYEGKGRVQRPDTQTNEPVAGGVEYGVNRATVQVPITVTTATRGCRVTVTAAAFDPALVGVAFSVVGVPSKTHATKRVLVCEEVAR